MWPRFVARELRQRGHDVVSVAERPALRTQPDPVILAAARDEDRVLVTEDAKDFRPLALAEVDAGRPYPAFIFTDNDAWLRSRSGIRAGGRLVRALDALLASGVTIEGEHWLTPLD
jgi:hypothetical protein